MLCSWSVQAIAQILNHHIHYITCICKACVSAYSVLWYVHSTSTHVHIHSITCTYVLYMHILHALGLLDNLICIHRSNRSTVGREFAVYNWAGVAFVLRLQLQSQKICESNLLQCSNPKGSTIALHIIAQ